MRIAAAVVGEWFLLPREIEGTIFTDMFALPLFISALVQVKHPFALYSIASVAVYT
jgi:hypothetical protein